MQRRQGVAVAVEGGAHLLVPQHLDHDLRVGAGRQLKGAEGVAQVVEANRRQLGPAQQRLERQGRQVPALQRLAGRVAEDEVVVGQAMPAGQQTLGLPRPVGSQQLEGRRGDLDRAPALGRFRIARPPATAHPH